MSENEINNDKQMMGNPFVEGLNNARKTVGNAGKNLFQMDQMQKNDQQQTPKSNQQDQIPPVSYENKYESPYVANVADSSKKISEPTPAEILDYRPLSYWERFKEFMSDCSEYVYPLRFRTYAVNSEEDQLRLDKQNAELALLDTNTKRAVTIKHNLKDTYKADLATIDQKNKLFKNWYKQQSTELKDKYAVNRAFAIDPKANIQATVSNYKGQANLCEIMGCDSVIVTDSSDISASHSFALSQCQADVSFQMEQNERLHQNNIHLKNYLSKLEQQCQNQQLAEPNHQSIDSKSQFNNNQYRSEPNRVASSEYYSKSENTGSESNSLAFPSVPPLQNEVYKKELDDMKTLLEQVLSTGSLPTTSLSTFSLPSREAPTSDNELVVIFDKLMSVPLQILNKDSKYWMHRKGQGSNPPGMIGRYLMAMMSIFIICFTLMTLYQLIVSVTRWSVEQIKKKKKQSKKRKSIFSIGEDNPDRLGEGILGVAQTLLRIRGGGTADLSVDEIDLIPIFQYIILQKVKLKMEEIIEKEGIINQKPILIRLFKKMERMFQSSQKKKSWLAYFAFAIATLDVRTTHISSSRNIQMQPDCFELRQANISGNLTTSKTKIQLGNTVIELGKILETNEEITEQLNQVKVKRPKTKIRKRAKVMRFSDLPPLPSSQFTESLTPSIIQPIRIKENLK